MGHGLKKRSLTAGEDTEMEKLPEGWLHKDAANFLDELVLATAELAGDFLEIGSWYGRSSIVIGLRVKELGGRLYCVDTWNTKSWDAIARQLPKGRTKFIWEEKDGEPLKKFTSNIRAARLEGTIMPLVGASESFKETWITPLRFIFVDGCHYYDFVREDAKWRDFLVAGGILAFHDYTNDKWESVRAAIDDEMDLDDRFEDAGTGQSIKAFKRTAENRIKVSRDMNVYHRIVPKGTEIILKKEPWVNEKYRKDYESFLEEIFNFDSEVIEFGSGGSSFYIAKRVKSLITLEYDSVWYKVVQEEIAKEGISNITIHFDPDYPKNFHCAKPCFDVAINDLWHGDARVRTIDTAMNCLRPGGYLIFHNHLFIEKLKKEGWIPVKNWGEREGLPPLNWKTAWRKPA